MMTDTRGEQPRREGPAALYGIPSDHQAFLRERQRRQAMYGAALAWHIVHRLGEGFDWNETAA